MMMQRWMGAVVCAAALLAMPARAAEPVGVVETIETRDADDRAVVIPVKDRTTLLAFVRGGQPQSQLVLRQVEAVTAEDADVQVIVVASGPDAAEQVPSLRRTGKAWPIVLDPAFAISGKLNVHAWPTTVLIAADARERAHLAGTPKSLRADLAAHLDFAVGRIDAAQLAARLEQREVVSDTNGEAAARRLEVARRLMRSGKLDAAREQIEGAMALKADDPALQVALARVMLLAGDADAAVKVLDAIPQGSVPPGQVLTLRGAAAVAREQWDEAKATLEEAVKLNPSPGEAYYLLGQVYEHAGDPAAAGRAYRQAFEATAEGDVLGRVR